MEGAVEVNWLRVGFALFNFAVVLFILIKFGGPKISAMLKERHLGIKKEIDEARGLREQAEKNLREYEARLNNIEQEMAALMASIRKEGETEAARIVAAAEESAARLKRDAEFLINQEARRLELELRHEAGTLAVELAKKIIEANLSEADQRRLADQFIRQVAGGGGGTHKVAGSSASGGAEVEG